MRLIATISAMHSSSKPGPDLGVAPRRKRGAPLLVITLAAVVALGGLYAVAFIRGHQQRSLAMNLEGRFAQLQLAFNNYHAANGSFPPSYAKGAAPPNAQSWRVALLPYMDLKDVHAKYVASEPWNSPANQRLAATLGEAPSLFRCPFSRNQSSQFADFVVVPMHRAHQFTDTRMRVYAIDCRGDRLIIVAIPDSTTHWMDPNGN